MPDFFDLLKDSKQSYKKQPSMHYLKHNITMNKNYDYSASDSNSDFNSVSDSDSDSDSNSVFINLDICAFFNLYLHSSK